MFNCVNKNEVLQRKITNIKMLRNDNNNTY